MTMSRYDACFQLLSLRLHQRIETKRLATDKVRPTASEAEIARVSVTSPGRKRTNTLVERTPGKPPTPARAAPTYTEGV
jgi:hypothetical protein